MTALQRILLVEDDDAVCSLLKSACKRLWRGVVQLESVRTLGEAMARCVNGDIDVILLDLTLPDSSKGETLKSIAELRALSDFPPIVVMTGCHEHITRVIALERGADSVVQKGEAMGFGVCSVLERCMDAHIKRQLAHAA